MNYIRTNAVDKKKKVFELGAVVFVYSNSNTFSARSVYADKSY